VDELKKILRRAFIELFVRYSKVRISNGHQFEVVYIFQSEANPTDSCCGPSLAAADSPPLYRPPLHFPPPHDLPPLPYRTLPPAHPPPLPAPAADAPPPPIPALSPELLDALLPLLLSKLPGSADLPCPSPPPVDRPPADVSVSSVLLASAGPYDRPLCPAAKRR